MRSPAPSRRALARSGGHGTALAVRPVHRPIRRPVGSRRPVPRRRTVRLGGRRYDRGQLATVVGLVLVLAFAAHGREVVGDTTTSETAPAAAGDARPVLDVALSQVGVVEASDRGTPFHDAFGIARREPWCAVWVWWVFQQAGESELVPKTAWTPAMAQFYRDRGTFDRTPQPGSLVFYDWPGDGKDRISHVGIVLAVEGDSIVALEANTRPGPGGDQSDGDGVYQRTRPLNASIVGFGHPAYAAA